MKPFCYNTSMVFFKTFLTYLIKIRPSISISQHHGSCDTLLSTGEWRHLVITRENYSKYLHSTSNRLSYFTMLSNMRKCRIKIQITPKMYLTVFVLQNFVTKIYLIISGAILLTGHVDKPTNGMKQK